MDHEQIEQVRQHMRMRVRQSEAWDAEGFPTSAFEDFRAEIGGTHWKIVPVEFLDLSEPEIERKQAKGIRFRLTSIEEQPRTAFVDVLLAPEWKTNEAIGTGPVIKIKAVDHRDGKRVSSKRDIKAPYVRVDDCNDATKIDDFYSTWLLMALAEGPKEKILEFATPAI